METCVGLGFSTGMSVSCLRFGLARGVLFQSWFWFLVVVSVGAILLFRVLNFVFASSWRPGYYAGAFLKPLFEFQPRRHAVQRGETARV